MNKDIEKALTAGLLAGYAGEAPKEKIIRGGFAGKAIHHEPGNGLIYHDEYFAGRLGGGQELVEVDGQKYTRVYIGGVIKPKELAKLGITEEQVITYLKQKIRELGERTRLFTDCHCEVEDDWLYNYTVDTRDEAFSTTTAIETISFKAIPVFRHYFSLCPIE